MQIRRAMSSLSEIAMRPSECRVRVPRHPSRFTWSPATAPLAVAAPVSIVWKTKPGRHQINGRWGSATRRREQRRDRNMAAYGAPVNWKRHDSIQMIIYLDRRLLICGHRSTRMANESAHACSCVVNCKRDVVTSQLGIISTDINFPERRWVE